MSANSKSVDLVIVGTGWHGLCAAKTFLQMEPNLNVIILDGNATIGGVWSTERLYPGIKANNMLGTYQYPDFPMDPQSLGFDTKPGQHVPGELVLAYLTKYAETFDVYRRIQFETKVISAEYQEEQDQWLLTIQRAGSSSSTIITKKMICATGMTSDPFIPKFEGMEKFDTPHCHTKELKKNAHLLKTATSVTVFGGNKSAWDAVYMFASKGIKVDWVIRESGHGPVWMSPAYVTPLKKWLEKLVTTRFLTFFSPCLWGNADGFIGYRNFLHGSAIGRAITNGFWRVLGNDNITLNKFDKHPETKKLKPWYDAFWIGSALSILNYPTDFFDLVRDGTVKVHIKEISHLSPQTVHLKSLDGSGELAIPTDALILATSWKSRPPITFLPTGIERDLGLPYHDTEYPDQGDSPLGKKADEAIFARFPRLKDQPVINPSFKRMAGETDDDKEFVSHNRPYQLHRFISPPTTKPVGKAITFAGMCMNIDTAINAQIQALWSYAHMRDRLPSTSPSSGITTEQLQWETTLAARFTRLRYPAGYSRRNPDFVFDAVPYFDSLLQDLEIQNRRKGGLMGELFSPYGPEDYTTIIDEWVAKNGKKE